MLRNRFGVPVSSSMLSFLVLRLHRRPPTNSVVNKQSAQANQDNTFSGAFNAQHRPKFRPNPFV